jgi:hypothetical protein
MGGEVKRLVVLKLAFFVFLIPFFVAANEKTNVFETKLKVVKVETLMMSNDTIRVFADVQFSNSCQVPKVNEIQVQESVSDCERVFKLTAKYNRFCTQEYNPVIIKFHVADFPAKAPLNVNVNGVSDSFNPSAQ